MIKQLNRLASNWGCRCDSEYIDEALDAICDNLPFGEETKTEYNTLFDNITVSENGSAFGSGVLHGASDFGVVNKFVVIFDGVEYNYEVTPQSYLSYYLGNRTLTNLVDAGENTGEPFCIEANFWFNVDDMREYVSDRIYLAEPGVNHTLTIKKKTVQTVVKQIAPKFRGFGEEVKLTEFIPEQTIEYPQLGQHVTLTKSIKAGKTYDVTINGKTYTLKAIEDDMLGDGTVITNSMSNELFSLVDNMLMFTNTGTHTFSIYEKEETVTKLDIKYLPIDELKTALGIV